MKKVVKSNCEELEKIDSCEVLDGNYYGVIVKGDKGIILATSYKGQYKVISKDKFTAGNFYGWESDRLDELVDLVLDNDCEVFEFDRFIDLAEWVNK